MAKTHNDGLVVDHANDMWWEFFSSGSLVLKPRQENAEKAATATRARVRPAPRKARQ